MVLVKEYIDYIDYLPTYLPTYLPRLWQAEADMPDVDFLSVGPRLTRLPGYTNKRYTRICEHEVSNVQWMKGGRGNSHLKVTKITEPFGSSYGYQVCLFIGFEVAFLHFRNICHIVPRYLNGFGELHSDVCRWAAWRCRMSCIFLPAGPEQSRVVALPRVILVITRLHFHHRLHVCVFININLDTLSHLSD